MMAGVPSGVARAMTGSGAGRRRPVIGVMGSGVDAQEALAAPLGRWIANQGFHLLTGGGGGVMAAVGRAFAEVADRDGLLVGVLPSQAGDPECSPPAGYPNRWVELVIRTHLPARGPHGASDYSRNHINVLTSDVVIGLPGGAGTASELALAVRYGRPCVAFLGDPAQMPNLPREVPRVTALNELAAFVQAALGERAPAPRTSLPRSAQRANRDWRSH